MSLYFLHRGSCIYQVPKKVTRTSLHEKSFLVGIKQKKKAVEFSEILTKKQKRLLLAPNLTSDTLSEKPWKYFKLRFKISQSLRVPPSGWKLSVLKLCLKDQLTLLEIFGKLLREKGLKITWKKLWKVIHGIVTLPARSQKCNWFKQSMIMEMVSSSLTFSTRLRT